ncbi:adenylosuccinate synthase [Clostridium gasigenes]|uniref:Adenylosuccinate synthetase n=1 Tax=Clostridium gasigenes TaxID=94869 RepID=A0A7X0SFV8_9CLOT|nr:adenylosuccinate synthase [Clostridium gasigenes]MBB6716764.1 adenylosuccinate synthase [Clostridium gasigenes]MBU3090070.1 adenylosuccinate synthase [Clostridium gasigenes]MBU3105966.1 adenylosuccinate synthase [Clostridium gasigenes]MBU3109754.1 adenylosuccinate synthase [Clostridium gasigenes]MBU3134487.1 adenylosuccinate synthase [Clostridium gasigenes]
MSAFIVLGAQWGDEGKGKLTDYLAEEANVVVRFQGGNNAGHTVEVGEKQYKLHLIPSGILHDDKLNVIGNGVAVDPNALFSEIDYLQREGVNVTPEKLIVSDRAQLIMPYHKTLDILKEKARGKNDIGTTGKGIGPCYTDKYERCGIRVCDLLHTEVFEEKLRFNIESKNAYITNVLGGEELNFDEIFNAYVKLGERLRPFVQDTSVRVYDEIKKNQTVLFEGAQGMLLDIDHGTYPYVTSSNTTAGGVSTGIGVGPTMITNVVGIAKAYTTRVGKGPFPTELEDATGEWIREKGHEYGTTTGRSRRCGWLDVVILKTTVRVCGLTSLVVTKIDTLANLEKIKVCVGYNFEGRVIDYFPASLEDLAKCEPIYEEFDGWDDSIADARSYDEIPENAKKYLKRIEELTETKISIVSVGPKRDQTIRVRKEL